MWRFRAVYSIICIAVISCSSSEGKKEIIEEYSITPKEPFVIYGYDIKNLINMDFGELEKKLGSEIKVDSEVAVVFIRKKKDFTRKSKSTATKDDIEAVYGPIEDLRIYKLYQEISPLTVQFWGTFSVDENLYVKESLIRELQKNFPDNDTAKLIIDKIRNQFILGKYSTDSVICINFKIPEFSIAEFDIGFSKYREELFYKYFFSLTENPYP